MLGLIFIPQCSLKYQFAPCIVHIARVYKAHNYSYYNAIN
ncbi:hypothetical protein BN863_7460 [Formosa agariphila KMM 3901]|uniref:Uncharacterized protein n=1 Tax=Formosa agariphila (strain DSM 15362 / KCTC 12365 / LMG 23005 / KMM 3901 / M-2Alg 35-1) TaxID=1347342 RepID=T2KJ43_FORAG|nr:hypothetical protein BN863_7460 [Formosa agariphila KMM 3901]